MDGNQGCVHNTGRVPAPAAVNPQEYESPAYVHKTWGSDAYQLTSGGSIVIMCPNERAVYKCPLKRREVIALEYRCVHVMSGVQTEQFHVQCHESAKKTLWEPPVKQNSLYRGYSNVVTLHSL